MTKAIKIRRTREDDWADLSAMITALYREDSGGEPMTPEKIKRTLSEFSRNPAAGAILIAELESRPIGYAILVRYWSNEHGGPIAILDELYIKPDWRNKGAGTTLIETIIEHEKGKSEALQLELNPANKRARAFYRRLGFRVTPNRLLRISLKRSG